MNRAIARPVHRRLSPLLIALALSGAALAQTGDHGSQQMHQAMTAGMQQMQAMKRTGDVDKDFAMMMKMHHQQALDMTKAEVQHGKSAELKAMAQKMIKDQGQEIAKLDAWLQKHK